LPHNLDQSIKITALREARQGQSRKDNVVKTKL